MGLEATTNINGLNALWPLGSDAKAQGDDHLRMLKTCLQNALSDDGTTVQLKRTSSFIRRQAIGASGAITLHADTKAFLVEVQGSGGGGGSSGASAANTGAAGAGGGGGGYVAKWIVKPTGTYTPSCTVGAASGAAGNASSFTDGTITLTASGGAVGTTGVGTGNSTLNGGTGGAAAGGDVNVPGQTGHYSSVVVLGAGFNAAARGGDGGNSRFGTGGTGGITNNNTAVGVAGAAANGWGAGGGGAASCYAGGVPGGGTSSQGVVIVTEFR